jgi:hypothetical protein
MQQKFYVIFMVCLCAGCATGSTMAATDQSPLELVDSCLSRLHTSKHGNNNVTLSAACPELSLQLDNPQLAQMDPPLDDETTLRQLHDVQHSLRSLQVQVASVPAPALEGLPQLLKKIYDPAKHAKPPENPIDKMLEWISQKIRHFFSQDNWLTRNFHFENKLGKNTIKSITNILVVLMVVLVLYILINELRAAKILKLFNRQRGKRRREQEVQMQATQATAINEIGELPRNHQVPALLRYTLQYLMDKQVLPRRYNLTNREFLAILEQKFPEASNDFASLVDSGERVVYGQQVLAAEATSQLIAQVKQIEQLPTRAGR